MAAKSTKIRPWMASSSFSFSGLMSVAVTWAPSFAKACRWKWQNDLFHAVSSRRAENFVLWVNLTKPHSGDENLKEKKEYLQSQFVISKHNAPNSQHQITSTTVADEMTAPLSTEHTTPSNYPFVQPNCKYSTDPTPHATFECHLILMIWEACRRLCIWILPHFL